MTEPIQGFILAGGRSSRMGVPKADLVIGGVSFRDRAADALSAIAFGGVTVIGPASGDKLRSIPDVDIWSERPQPPGGALVGLYTAFLAAGSGWVAVLACDTPFVTGELLIRLASVDRTGLDAVVPLDLAGTSQPLCALYNREPCLAAAERCFEHGDLSLRALLNSVNTRYILPSQLGPDLPMHSFLNVNTPADLEAAIRLSKPVIAGV